MPPPEISKLHAALRAGDRKALARGITIVENELAGSDALLRRLNTVAKPRIIGITGPPGAGKSTLVNALLQHWTDDGKNVAVIAVDPSSPFHYGSLLGDRIRMSRFYNHPQVFIRSLASRGALGGLHPRIYEITDVIAEAGFDIILIETVGVGQSEVDIAGIADCTVVALVPEAGDMIQTMKAGLMEIADILVVNKSDRPDAATMYRVLRTMAHEQCREGEAETPVLMTTGSTGEGVAALAVTIDATLATKNQQSGKQIFLRTQKLYRLVQSRRMQDVKPAALTALLRSGDIALGNLYRLADAIAARKIPHGGAEI